MKLGAEEFGIHAFLASNTVTDEYYPKLAGILFRLAVRHHERTGARINSSICRAAWGSPTARTREAMTSPASGKACANSSRRSWSRRVWGMWPFSTEMGRYMLAPYGALLTTAIHEKHIYKEYIGVDACAANLMRPAMYGAYHHLTVLGKENAPCDHKYDVTGGLCENNDKFAIDRMLPEIEKGDVLFIHDAGAHGFSWVQLQRQACAVRKCCCGKMVRTS